jgi:hypothetical protein
MCDIIILNVNDPTKEHVLDKLLKYHTKILLGDCNAKLRREDIF